MRKKEERSKEMRMERKTDLDWWRKKGKSATVSLIINVVKLQIRKDGEEENMYQCFPV